MHDSVQALGYLNLAGFLTLAAAGIRLRLRRRGSAGLWAMLAFAALALFAVLARLLPTHPHGPAEWVLQRATIAVLLVFPYLLFRFTTAFDRPAPRVAALLNAVTLALVVWTFAQPSYPAAGEPRPVAFVVYVVAFLVHWSLLSSLSAWRLWRAGRGQPSVARRRMRLLAAATAGMTAALCLSVVAGDEGAAAVAAQALALASSLAFLLGLTPPAGLRLLWRRPEQRRLQQAVESLIAVAKTREEVVGRVLAPMAAIVGARSVALLDAAGEVMDSHGLDGGPISSLDGAGSDRVTIELQDGLLVVRTSPYAPFFGEDEFDLLRSLGSLTSLALDRVRLFAQEHESRVALERANEVMARFVSLAAHELRTPVTTIHGFVHTLNHLGDRLSAEQREEVSRTLEQQTSRMALLVEQLLDLSRLDADAIEIVPQRFPVRPRVTEIVAGVGGDDVDVEVAEELEAVADPQAFDRIMANLVANAVRYGDPPVVVRAEQTDRHLRVWVEDHGPGVADHFVPNLFERFARSSEARERSKGTGLGLAIARSYARAHGGDVLYEHADPHGACFQLVLPVPQR